MSLTAAGLSTEEAERRSATEGPNRLPRPPRPAPLRQLARQFPHLLAVLLWVAADLSARCSWANANTAFSTTTATAARPPRC